MTLDTPHGEDPWTPGQQGLAGRAGAGGLVLSVNARRQTASGRRERLRRGSCGEGLGRHPESLTKQLNHNQILKFKIKTKRGKLVKLMIYELFEIRECNFARSRECVVFVCVL